MKKTRFNWFVLGLFVLGLAVASCGNETAKESGSEEPAVEQTDNVTETATDATTAQTGKEYTSKYVCPMHCKGSGSDEAGKCPVCGMDYVLNEKQPAEEGDGHDHDHGDHDHSHGG